MGTSIDRRALRAVGLGTLVLAAILASSVILLSCASVRQSSFQGDLSGALVESTYIDMASADPFVRVSGTLLLESGGFELTLKEPDGTVAYSRRFVRDVNGFAPKRIPLDETKPSKPGVWLLEISGIDDSAVGNYDLTLSNR